MKNQDQPAYPVENLKEFDATGLTKRELLAAIEQLNDMDSEETVCCDAYKSNLVGMPCPKWNKANAIKCEMFEAEFRAKVRVIRADALLAELDKENVCEWRWHKDSNTHYTTSCGKHFAGPETFPNCPYCGRKIKEVK